MNFSCPLNLASAHPAPMGSGNDKIANYTCNIFSPDCNKKYWTSYGRARFPRPSTIFVFIHKAWMTADFYPSLKHCVRLSAETSVSVHVKGTCYKWALYLEWNSTRGRLGSVSSEIVPVNGKFEDVEEDWSTGVKISAAAMPIRLEAFLHSFGKLLGRELPRGLCVTLVAFGPPAEANLPLASNTSSVVPSETECW